MSSQRFSRTLHLEPLGDRLCPSCTVIQAGTTALVLGDATDNTVQISDSRDALSVTCDGSNSTLQGDSRLVVQTLGGNDSVKIQPDDTGGGVQTLQLNLGTGDDIAALFFARPAAPGGQAAGGDGLPLNLALSAGAGDDVVLLRFGRQIADANVHVQALLGDGNDTFDCILPSNPQSQARIHSLSLNVQGGGGDDGIDVEASGIVVSDYVLRLSLRGGAGNDALSLDAEGTLGNPVPFAGFLASVDGGDGDDLIGVTVHDSHPDGTTGVAIMAGTGDDDVTVDVQNARGLGKNESVSGPVVVNGWLGFDSLTVPGEDVHAISFEQTL